MAYCTQCGNILKEGAQFCTACGAKVKNSSPSKRKEVFVGEVRKCPNCGQTINAFVASCPSCGYEFRNVETSSAVKEFEKRLREIENNRKPSTSFSNFSKAIGAGRTDYADEQIINLIRNFSVPNTKDDLYEFLMLAVSNINTSLLSANNSQDVGLNGVYELNVAKAKNDAWIAKMEQVYQKAELMFSDKPDFQKIKFVHDQTMDSVEEEKRRKNNRERFLVIFLIVFVLFLFGMHLLLNLI